MKSSNLVEVVATANAEPAVKPDVAMIGHVEVSLAAQVGTITTSIDKLFALKSGDVLSMNELLDSPLTLMLNGRPVARGELVAVDDNFGVRILELA